MPDARTARDLQVVDTVLTNIAQQYRPTGFVYNQLAPTIRVAQVSGLYPTFSNFFGDASDSGDQTKVADRAETPEITFEWSTESYLCEPYRLKASITDREQKNAHSVIKLRQSKLTRLLDAMAIRREVRLATLLTDSGTTGGALTGGTTAPTAWTGDTATIESDIKTGALAVRDKIGRMTNTILFDLAVGYAVAVQQDIREILKYTVPGDEILRRGNLILPPVIHGHKVVVAEALRNTAKKGATESLGKVWADDVRLLYVAENGGWGEPSVAYSFAFEPEKVDRWVENDPPVEYVRAWEDVDEKVCAPNAGYTLTSVLS